MDKATTNPTGISAEVISHVEVDIEAHVGKSRINIGDLSALKSGSVITLDAGIGQDVELRLNGVVVAFGELVAVEDNFAVRITRIVGP